MKNKIYIYIILEKKAFDVQRSGTAARGQRSILLFAASSGQRSILLFAGLHWSGESLLSVSESRTLLVSGVKTRLLRDKDLRGRGHRWGRSCRTGYS